MNHSTSNPRQFFRKEKPQLTFKIFFDPDSGRCLHKTTGENIRDLPFIVVDQNTYTEMDTCVNYQVVNGKIEKTVRGIIYKKLIKSATGIFKTTKNNMIFIVTGDHSGPVDTWNFYKHDN